MERQLREPEDGRHRRGMARWHAAGVLALTLTLCGALTGLAGASEAVASTENLEFKSWVVKGRVIVERPNQVITLPSGSTFTGSGERDTSTGAGTVTGTLTVPPLGLSLRLFGVIPINVGVTLTQDGPINGTIADSLTTPGSSTLTLPVALNVAITSVQLLTFSLPTAECSTTGPLTLTLGTELTQEALTTGWGFAGPASIPSVTCNNGLLSAILGRVLTAALSGPGSSYSLSFTSPS